MVNTDGGRDKGVDKHEAGAIFLYIFTFGVVLPLTLGLMLRFWSARHKHSVRTRLPGFVVACTASVLLILVTRALTPVMPSDKCYMLNFLLILTGLIGAITLYQLRMWRLVLDYHVARRQSDVAGYASSYRETADRGDVLLWDVDEVIGGVALVRPNNNPHIDFDHHHSSASMAPASPSAQSSQSLSLSSSLPLSSMRCLDAFVRRRQRWSRPVYMWRMAAVLVCMHCVILLLITLVWPPPDEHSAAPNRKCDWKAGFWYLYSLASWFFVNIAAVAYLLRNVSTDSIAGVKREFNVLAITCGVWCVGTIPLATLADRPVYERIFTTMCLAFGANFSLYYPLIVEKSVESVQLRIRSGTCAEEPQGGLAALLNGECDRETLHSFRSFVQHEFELPSLIFYERVNVIRRLVASNAAAKALRSTRELVIQARQDGEHPILYFPIELTSQLRGLFMPGVKMDAHIALLDEAQQHVYEFLLDYIYPRYVQQCLMPTLRATRVTVSTTRGITMTR